jgi:hypothetical protein
MSGKRIFAVTLAGFGGLMIGLAIRPNSLLFPLGCYFVVYFSLIALTYKD